MQAIASALVKAQKEFGPALKTSTNPHFRSRYADLSACVEAVIDALNNNGIMMMQFTHPCDNGVIVETIFMHESGEHVSGGRLHVPASKNDPQGYGSALTYARRYSLQAACGIAPEDDDGNAASKPTFKEVPKVEKKADDRDRETLIFVLELCETLDEIKEQYKKMTPSERALIGDVKEKLKQKFEAEGKV